MIFRHIARNTLVIKPETRELIPFPDQSESRREAADSAVARQGEATTYRIDLELESHARPKAEALGAHVVVLPRLHDASMRKIDQHNTSFWKAINNRESPDALGLLERQRVKTWLKNTYAIFDRLPV